MKAFRYHDDEHGNERIPLSPGSQKDFMDCDMALQGGEKFQMRGQ